MQINDGGTAYPMQDAQAIHAYAAAKTPEHGTTEERDRAYTAARAEAVGGMSLRDAFAKHAMSAMVASREYVEGGWEQADIAKQAYQMADAMLRAQEQS